MSNITYNNTHLISPNDINIILGRCVFSFISLFCCLFLIIIYIILVLQIKFNLCQKSVERDSHILCDEEDSFYSPQSTNNNNKVIGLGSHLIFLLTISNFIAALFESTFYFYYKNINTNCIDESSTYDDCIKLFIDINDSQICKALGFFHNFFDLYAFCWTTMLTLLFYRSTKITYDMNQKTKKYIIIGFIYCTSACIIITLIPCITGDNYGFNRFYCSYRYYHDVEKDGKGYMRTETSFWRYSLFAIVIINLIFHVLCLFSTHKFYSEKLKILKKQDQKAYKSLIIFVWVFRLLPIIMVLSRIYRGITRFLVNLINGKNNDDDTSLNVVEYINSFIYSGNGIIISLMCLIFFRSIFTCCSSKITKEKINSNNFDMRFLEDDNN